MTGTALHESNPSVTATTGAATKTVDRVADNLTAATLALHLTHGLVAIANGPDYCLCGSVWPCDGRLSVLS